MWITFTWDTRHRSSPPILSMPPSLTVKLWSSSATTSMPPRPSVLPSGAWTHCADLRAHNVTTLAAGHAALPPTYYSGPHAPGTADTDEIRTRGTFVLNPSAASTYCTCPLHRLDATLSKNSTSTSCTPSSAVVVMPTSRPPKKCSKK